MNGLMASTTSSRLAFTLGLTMGITGCQLLTEVDRDRLNQPNTTSVGGMGGSAGSLSTGGAGGSGGISSVGGMGGSGGVGGTGYPTDHIPGQSLPANGQLLAPTHAFLSWQDGVIPDGFSTWYRSCLSMDPTSVSDPNSCPNEIIDTNLFRVLESLSPMQAYSWKVQTCYDAAGTDCTDYSAVHSLNTDNSLIGWWRMDDGAGTTASDTSTFNNDGTLNNFDLLSAWDAGLIGTSLLFDANNDYVDLFTAYNFDSSNNFTVDIWARRNNGDTVQSLFSRMDFTAATRRGYRISYTASNQIKVQLRSNDSNGNSIELDSNQAYPVLPSDPFQNITVTYDASSLAAGVILYTDGVAAPVTVTTDNLTGPMTTTAPTWIGAQVGPDFMTPDRVFDGSIDEVAVFNRTLPIENIVNNHCASLALALALPLPLQCN